MAIAVRPLVSFTLLLSSLSFSVVFSSRDLANNQREFDYFLLSLLWPGTNCQGTSYCCPSNGCCSKSVPLTEFTIHGLWTDYNDGTWPACCSGNTFDLEKISPLIGTLEKYWPSLSCSSSSNCHGGKGLFWAHEWEKHGTCAYPIIKDELAYFSTTLDLYFKYNITKILNDARILPSNSNYYQLSDVINVIKHAVGASPTLVCSHGRVEELYLCFHKDYTPRDCVISTGIMDGTTGSSSSCPSSITLPIYTPPGLAEENSKITWRSTDDNFEALARLSI